MSRYDNISNKELSELIDNWIKSERDRKILYRRLIDGICYEALAEEFELSRDQIKRIVYKGENLILKHIPEPQEEILFGEKWYTIA